MVISENAMGKRILIADDSVTIQKAFAMTLGSEDFALTTARSADEGLTLARQTRPDLVIADAAMPGRSGYELCAALKADAALRAIPVYILSSTQRPYDEAKGQQVGADGTLIKPWDSTALIEKLKDAAGRPADTARPAASPAAARATTSLPVAALEVEAPRDTAPTPARTTATSMPTGPFSSPTPPSPTPPSQPMSPAMPAMRPAAPAGVPPGGMRPSLIPGMRPGAVPPVRPGTSPSRTLGNTVPLGPTLPPRPAAAAPVGRTLFGLPAASMPFPGSTRPASATAAPAPAPSYSPAPSVSLPGLSSSSSFSSASSASSAATPAPEPIAARPAASPALSSSVASLVDQKVAAIAAKGPEYEALAKLSREVIEQIVWEIVPELAEAIIREHVAKRGTV
jgi:CheY-like chemotaxis protein